MGEELSAPTVDQPHETAHGREQKRAGPTDEQGVGRLTGSDAHYFDPDRKVESAHLLEGGIHFALAEAHSEHAPGQATTAHAAATLPGLCTRLPTVSVAAIPRMVARTESQLPASWINSNMAVRSLAGVVPESGSNAHHRRA